MRSPLTAADRCALDPLARTPGGFSEPLMNAHGLRRPVRQAGPDPADNIRENYGRKGQRESEHVSGEQQKDHDLYSH
jgi:hypothetical protein